MNQSTVRPNYSRLTVVCLLVLCTLLGAVVRPSGALAANVPNPDEALIARWEPCEPNTGVTVIVDERKIGTGKVYVGCALGEQANGVQALEHAGFHIEGTKEYGLAFICRIEGEPTLAEQSCEHSAPANAYWSYWHGKAGGRWGYSGAGAYGYKPALGSVEGWGFAGGPRIEPMDGSGPSSFSLPAAQGSSVIPARLAREWLTPTLNQTAVQTEEDELGKREELSSLKTVLRGAVTLVQAGVAPAKLAPITHWLSRTCEEKGVQVGSCVLRGFAEPKAASEDQYPDRYAEAILALRALGENPSSFDGEDLRGTLEGLIEEATGKVAAGGTSSGAVYLLAPTVLALARTGALPAKVLKTVEVLLAHQEAGTGSFEVETRLNVDAIEALAAAREKGVAVLGEPLMGEVEAALTKAGENLEHLQESDGSVRAEGPYEEGEPEPEEGDPTIESTALGAIGLTLTGHSEAAEHAAKWLSRYQITAEYAGIGDPETGEHTPAEGVIGAFTDGEGALKEALSYGIHSSEQYGVHGEAQAPTIYALAALTIAGPYGPYDASFDQQSLFFESLALGSPTKPLAATLTSQDVRPVTVTALQLTGGQSGDFQITGGNCAGRTLQSGEVCEVQLAFDPSALGLRETQLQATLTGTSQTIDLPLAGTGIPAPEPQPQPKPEPGPGPVVSPSSPTSAPTHTASGPVVGLTVPSIGPTRLLLKLTTPGVVTVKIARRLGKGHRRNFQTVKTITVKAGKAGTLKIKLPQLAAGSYRVSISLTGAGTVVETLTVPRKRR
jgi:hypothetical protein